MPRVFQIKVEEGQTLEHTAEWLALSASAVVHELFPDQWYEGMSLMTHRIHRSVADRQPRLVKVPHAVK